jgi:hypothetical protein
MLDLRAMQPIHYAHSENTAVLTVKFNYPPWLTTPNLLAKLRNVVRMFKMMDLVIIWDRPPARIRPLHLFYNWLQSKRAWLFRLGSLPSMLY